MVQWSLSQEPILRLGILFGVLGIMSIWEMLAPRRALSLSKTYRWVNNWGIVMLNTAIARVLFPAGLIGLAFLVESEGWGLLQLLDLPFWVGVVIALVILDFTIWAQHVFFHAVPVFWRLHRMHHADLDFDVTTGLRFHPIEILLSFGIKAGAIVLIGAPAIAVLTFEIILSSLALFNHSNARLPSGIDRVLRWFIVTPDYHRVHHSWYPDETNSNYGFNLSLWDRLFRTYRPQPRDGHEQMTIGLNLFREPDWERLDRMLIQPFVGPTHSAPIKEGSET